MRSGSTTSFIVHRSSPRRAYFAALFTGAEGFTGAALMPPGFSAGDVEATPIVPLGFGSGFGSVGLALIVLLATPIEAVFGSSVRPTRVGSAGAGAGVGLLTGAGDGAGVLAAGLLLSTT